MRCFSSSTTRNSESVHFAQCIDDKGHVVLGHDKPDLGVLFENIFNHPTADIVELENPSHIYSIPIANIESPETNFKYIPAVESANQQIIEAQKTIEFWKNYVKRINLNLQGLSNSIEN